MTNINWFPEGFIELQKELLHHPDMQEKLAKVEPANDYSLKIAKLCAEFDILLDGDYSVKRQEEICYVLIRLLREKRKLIVTH